MAPASGHSPRWLLVAAAASSVACTQGNASGVTRREFDLFSISVPTAWTQVVYGPSDVHKGLHQFGGPGVRFEGPDGEYLDISPDLAIDGPANDVWWAGKPSSDGGLVVEGPEKLCEKAPSTPKQAPPGEFEPMEPPPCMVGDQRLDAAMFFESRGHGYVITFGNDKRERAEDLKPFKTILASFKAK